ncbi:aromatic ring-hydroxylating dioxygenase subunit alpha [Streptomyces sp. NPDC050856]|uniref:aromatic ring-hydroxylating oxygenase subunit alpha n=1 Tax=Streptomyces sp. NPDC050856 TaxID=3154939 RepID=UPI0033C96C91
MRYVEGERLAERAALPATAYTSQAQFERERERVFTESWVYACPVREVSRPGAAIPVEVAGRPVIITRDSDGRLHAFHNVCSHRGTKLLCEPKEGRKTLVCAYHAWIYSLDGQLIRSRHFAGVDRHDLPDLPAAELGLKPLAVGEWLDFVFVHFDPAAAPLETALAPLVERWQPYDLSLMQHTAHLRYDFQANWKLIVENFLESYHVPFIHQTLNTYSPFTERYQLRLSEDLIGIGQGLYAPAQGNEQQLPRWPAASDDLRAEYFSLFPNFLIGLMPDHLFAWHLDPQAADRTVEHLDFYFVGDAAHSPAFENQRTATLENWKQVNDEDWDIVQRMQIGCSSPAFDRAVLSRRMERNINHFQENVLQHTGEVTQ